jgi:hypothetical protein
MSKASDKHIQDELDSYDSLTKIVEQLEFANYENEASVLTQNVAFIKLKQLAQAENQKDLK